MGRNVEHGRILSEYLLSAVAVMDVQVDNGNPLVSLLLKILRRDGYVVEVAESHPVVPSGMMSRRSGQCECRPILVLRAHGGIDRALRGQRCDPVGLGVHSRVECYRTFAARLDGADGCRI